MDEFNVLPDMNEADFPYLDDSTLLEGRAEKLVAGELPGEYPADDVRALSDLLSAMRAPARPQELGGEVLAVAAFAAAKEKTVVMEKAALKEKGNVIRLPRHLGPKVGAATAVAMLALTGVAAAAVTGTLPAPLQSFVHSKIGVIAAPATAKPLAGKPVTAPTTPAPTPSSSPTPVPVVSATPAPTAHGVGPLVGGSSTAGLCHAFGNRRNSSSAAHSSAARNLQAAAAAAGESVEAFCAPYLTGNPNATKSHGKPTGPPVPAVPTPAASGHGHHPHPTHTSGNGNGKP